MNKELRRCPFCGGEARWANDEHNWIECSYCGAEIRYFTVEEEAIEAWNRREPMDRIIKQLEREVEWVKVNCGGLYVRTGATLELLKAIEIVKGGSV